MKTLTTLCILRDGDTILLAMKKRGFGVGYFNGYGGKVEEGETIEDALKREVKEESGLDLLKYTKRGEMDFYLIDGSIKKVHIYEGEKWQGKLIETEEMKPKWATVGTIPYEHMWKSDVLWYPFFINREYFTGKVYFDENRNVTNFLFE